MGDRDRNRYVGRLSEYYYYDQNKGTMLKAVGGNDGWTLSETLKNKEVLLATIDGALFANMEAIPSFADMPNSMAAWQALPQRLTPEGYAMLSGVRLREKTSTRSRILGDFLPGTLIKDLGREQGDPFPWLKGSIGRLNGYVSTHYINPPEGQGGQSHVWTRLLPVAGTTKETRLRNSVGWFNSGGTDLPKGSRMHVLTDEGEWLYVCVPRGDLGFLMDVDGAYGYVHRNDVVMAATAIQLDWLSD